MPTKSGIFRRALSLALALVMALSCAPFSAMAAGEEPHEHAAETAAVEALAGKTISVLGASISTYQGTSNGAAADTTNSTIRGNVKYYPNTTIPEVTLYDTWWMQVAQDLDLRLLVNNSWSGSAIFLERSGTVGAYVDRCVQLHDDTGDNAGEEPDIICIQMGFNDFSYGKATLGNAEIDYDSLISDEGYGEPATTMEATAIMLDKMVKRYPDAEIYMFNHFKRIGQSASDTQLMEGLNASIADVCARFGVKVVDLYTYLTSPEYIGDGKLHPNCFGMDVIAEAVKHTIVENTAYSVNAHTVKFELDGVSVDYGTDKIVMDGYGFKAELFAADELSVTVTMGGEDITASAFSGSCVSITSVTGDVIISAKSVHEPRHYRWSFDGTELAAVTGDNALTRLSGTVTDGQFDAVRYELEQTVVLQHDRPWVLEWKSAGDMQNGSGGNGCRLLNEAELNNTENAFYLFKSSNTYIIALGERVGGVGQNYGIALADYGIDGAASHTYRLENRIADDGSNMVYLSVDGTELGAMNHHYKALNDTGNTSNWVSGKDFTFNYMGTAAHALTNCSIDYVEVWEAGEETGETITLFYDDRYDVAGMDVEIIDAGTPTSYQVGYGVEENTVLDTAVITRDGDTLIATGIGTAKVKIDGVTYNVTVETAPISLLLLAGQSNMEGMVGNANQSIACEDGQVYATYAKANGLTGDAGLTVENAGNYVASALAGEYSSVNVNGTDTKLSGYPINSLVESGSGKYGMDSGIAYEWTQQTGEKLWVVNAAHGASSITSWQKGQSNYEEALALFSACEDVLQREIAAGHYSLSHMGYYWCQGCADETQTAEWYANQYISMHEDLKAEFGFDHDLNEATPEKTLEFGNIVLVMAGHENAVGYRNGVYSDESEKFFASFKELEMRGPRVAQIWMANNPELEDIHIVSTIAQDWVTMPDGTNGVKAYFDSHYPSGVADYPTQVKQSDSWYAPTTPEAVKSSIHYNQLGYNEVGREAVRNTLFIIGEAEKPDVETKVSFLNWTGYESAEIINGSAVPNSRTLVVPMVYPCYESKNVSYTVSEGLSYSYYDLLDSGDAGGTLAASVGENYVEVLGREYAAYRFELKDGVLSSVSNDRFKENTLTKNGSTNTFSLSEAIVLKHDREWIVEFDSADTARFMALASAKSSVEGMTYFFKSQGGSGVLAIGEYVNGLYENYGLLQSEVDIDWNASHVYSFRNVINNDGSNTIHIYIDDEWVGTATNHIVNGVVKSRDNNYLSGKDFVFANIGCGGFALDRNQMTYLAVWEDVAETTETISLFYDDRYDVAGMDVEIIDAGTPTSYQVGYGVEENTVHDTAVITRDGDTLIATGIGTAVVKVDGVTYNVTVETAPISLLLLAGQSNMRGSEGSAAQSIVCPEGMVYSTYGDDRGDDNTAMTVSNASNFAASALTGAYSSINVNGTTDCLSGYPVYSLTEAGAGKIGPDSGFAYEWVQQTGEKVWVVNAAHGGTSINVWQPEKTEYEECKALFTACAETLRKEIAAGHFTLSHMAYFWCQGCSDRTQSAQWYGDRYLTMHEAFKTELAFDHDSDPTTANKEFEFGGIIPVRVGNAIACYRDGVNTDSNPYSYHESFVDLRMSGPRVAQYLIGCDPGLPDIWLTCTIGEDWVWMPDGTNGVSDYFNRYYENGTVDYTTQEPQSQSWYTPTTPKDVHDSIHYNQIGYNEIGRESVRNALIMLGEKEDYDEETTVRLVDWTGYKDVTEITAATTAGSGTLVVPIISPVTRAKTVTFTHSEGLEWRYGDLIALSAETTGSFGVDGMDVSLSVVKGEPGQLYADHLADMPESYCAGTDLWKVLEHDPQYFASGTRWAVYSSGREVPSVTIPVEPGDKIFATSFGKSGENGHESSSGIRVTFFSEYGVAKTLEPASTYAEFSANGYLTAPEGATAINVPMWNNEDTNELYVLSAEHSYICGICAVCGKSDGLNHASPTSQGITNAIKRAYALTDVKWTPLVNMPGVVSTDGVYSYQEFYAGVEYTGVPYSGVIATDTYVGLNVSLGSFLTALENENSVLYTENLYKDSYPKAASYFGTVCSKFAQYALFIPGAYNTANVPNIPGMTTVAAAGAYSAEEICLGDVIVDTGYHTALITDIIYNEDGSVAFIEVSEAIAPTARRLLWSVNEFFAEFDSYRLCRYEYIDRVPAPETVADADYALMPRMGSGYNYEVSNSPAVVDILADGYEKAVVVRNGEVTEEITLSGNSFEFDRSLPGNIEMYLEKADGSRSESVYAKVVDCSITVTDASEYANGKLKVSIEYSDGIPIYVQVGSAQSVFCPVDGADSHEISFNPAAVGSKAVRLGVITEYGIYLSDWVGFSADTNPSTDPILSQGEYWPGRTLTPSSSTPVQQEGKEGHWTYTMVPVEGGATYYSEGANRSWYFDSEGNAIGTVNVYSEGDTPFMFTTPENAAFMSLTYSPNLVEQGTETMKRVSALSDYSGKVISILSDSTSTFGGYCPEADGFNLHHRCRYPQSNLITDVNETWWMQVITELDAKLGINESWAGSMVFNNQDTNSGDYGPDAAMASMTRILNLGSNGTPDVILFYGAGNDIRQSVPVGSFDPAVAPTAVDLTATKWETFADAYVAAIMRLQHVYPDSQVLVMLYEENPAIWSDEKLASYNDVIQSICDHYGVPILDLRGRGFTADMFPDGAHPNAAGMDIITEAVLEALADLPVEAGENVVYTVIHALSGAKAELHYYEGVSHGAAFTEAITGDDLTVTVSMGGMDITATAYKNGTVTIPSVTGDLVITAKSDINVDGHLQQLPETLCAGLNLWTALEPENIYYTVDGWGLFANSPKVHSVTFPVKPGERVWASSFGYLPENGNGTRITWFAEDGLLETVDRNTIYNEFTKDGYITVPAGAASLNVPMPNNDSKWEIYLLDRAHSYADGICTICGKKAPDSLDDAYVPPTFAWPTIDTDLTHIVAYGQSFSNGSDAPGYPDPIVDGTYVLGSITGSKSGDSLRPLQLTRDTQHPIASAVNSLSQMLTYIGVDTDIIAGSYGTGGRTIAQLMSPERQQQIKDEEGYSYDCADSGRYAVFQNSVAAIADYAETNGKSVSCPAIVYLQGETDQNTDEQLGYPENPIRAGYGAGGDKEKYKEYMSRLKEDMQREVMEAYGQTEKPLFLIYQVSGTYVRTAESSINMAQIEFAQENEDVILIQSPYFAPHYTGSHHLTVNGYRWLGEYIALDLYDALVKQIKRWPMLPAELGLDSNGDIRIRVNGAENGLAVDTWTVEDATNANNLYGFEVILDGSRVAPDSITVGGDEIILGLPDGKDAAAADSVFVRYGGQGARGTGNIRDNSESTGFYAYLDDSGDIGTGGNQGVSHSALDKNGNSIIGQPYPLYNWLASFYYEVEGEMPHTHSYTETYVEPNCSESGYTIISCPCGIYTKTEGEGPNGEHAYTATVTAPTCTEQGYTTYTCTVCGDSYVGDYTDPRPLNILMIGNSFSWDAADFWYNMQESMTYDAMKSMLADPYDVHLAVMYKGSATLAYHATCAMNNTAGYTYTEIGPETNYKWTPSSGQNATNNILDQLEAREWDIIVIQSYQHEADGTEPRSTYTGGDARFVEPEASVGYLLDYFAEHEPNAEVYYYMPWATTKFYDSDTADGYQGIAEYTQNHVPYLTGINGDKQFAGIIPVGTGIQNARTTYFDALQFRSGTGSTALLKDPQNGLQYDSQHLSFGIGRYIAGAVVAETLIPQAMRMDSYTLPGIKDSPAIGELPEEYTEIAQKAVEAALSNPYSVTAITGYETDPAVAVIEKIEQLNPDLSSVRTEAELEAALEEAVQTALNKQGFAAPDVTIENSTFSAGGELEGFHASVELRYGYTTSVAELVKHSYTATVTAPTCTEGGYTTYTCTACGDSYVGDYTKLDTKTGHDYVGGVCTLCGHSVLGSNWIAPDLAYGDYTMVAVPDTQILVQYWPEVYYGQMQWIADNKDELNIQAVLHMGDMVNNNNDTEWTVCETGTGILDAAGIAWMPMRGNHDDSEWFNRYYDYSTYGTERSWFGGSYEEGRLDHSYWFVSAGDREYLILSLGWAPGYEVLDWARGIVEDHPEKNVIIVDHAYMNKDGTLLSEGDAHCVSSYYPGYPDGEDVWAAFRNYENVVFAASGHIHSADLVTWTDVNVTNCDVTSMLVDCQNTDLSDPLGMVALLTFHSDSNSVDVNWYSTRYDALYKESNQFEISVPHVHEHEYSSKYREADCTNDGGTEFTCSICGYSYIEGYVPAFGHDIKEIVTEPTCTEDGYTTLMCARCGENWPKTADTDLTNQFAWNDGYAVSAVHGGIVADKNWIASDYMDVSEYDSIGIITADTVNANTTLGLAFYDANKNYISGVLHTDGVGEEYGVLVHELDIPENAVYVRSTWYSDAHPNYESSFGDFACIGIAAEKIPAKGHSYDAVVTAPTCTEGGYTTYTCQCGDSYVGDYTDPRPLNILMIGNSFSWDAADAGYGLEQSQMYETIRSMLVDGAAVQLGVLVKGSSTLGYHATCAKNGTAQYKYAEIGPHTDHKWSPASGGTETNSIRSILEKKDWDIVVLQAYEHEADNGKPKQGSYVGGAAEFVSPTASIPHLLDFLASNEPQAEVYYYMPWASAKFYGVNGTDAGFDGIAAYTAANVMDYAGTESGKRFAGVIPVGTGIQNARTTYLDGLDYGTGDGGARPDLDIQVGLLRDRQHLSFGIGRYIAGAIMAETLLPAELRADSYVLPDVKDSIPLGQLPEEYTEIAKKAVKAALENPYGVTNLAGYETDPADVAKAAIEAAAYDLTGVHSKQELQTALEAAVAATVTNEAVAVHDVTIRDYELSSAGAVMNLSAQVTVCYGYTICTAEISRHAHKYESVVTVPTCTEQGYTAHTCTACGDSYVDNYVPAAGHKAVTDSAVAATCTKSGLTSGSHCEVCGVVIKAQEIVPATGHNWDKGTVTKEPTETTEGVMTYKCQSCGETKTAAIPVLGHTHKYETKVTAPTCTEQGYTTYSCPCGHSYIDNYVSATGHKAIADAAVAASCTKTGLTAGTHCGVCGVVIKAQEVIPATGHSWDKGTVTKEPTETTEGVRTYKCTSCGETKTETIPVLGHEHKYTAKVTAPTCTEQGYTTYSCACGHSYIDNYVAATGHKAVADAAVAATCTKTGLTAGTHCSVCGVVIKAQEVTPATGHNWDKGTVTKEPTEETEGIRTYKCTACGETKTESIPVLGHEHKCTAVVTAPTCARDGYTTFTCVCGESYIDNVTTALGHKAVTDASIAATCTRSGLTSGSHCTVCGEVTKAQEVIPATGHSWDKGTVTKEPTEETEGVKTFRCETCGETKTESIPVLGHEHKYTSVVTAPTCTEQGYTTYTCPCGESYVADQVAAKGHKWDEGRLLLRPTTAEAGIVTRSCTACGESREESADRIPAPGFIDVPKGSWFYESVAWAADADITKGVTVSLFDPEGGCTRAHVVTFLWRSSGCPEAESDGCAFADVSSDAYYYEAVLWAAEKGITLGTGETEFSPDQPCTRAQIASFIWRWMGKPAAEGKPPFKDTPEGAWYADAVLWASESGVTSGVGGDRFAPDDGCTRAQIVTFLWRATDPSL